MTSIATLYKEWGHEVAGSDTDEEFFTDKILRELQIPIVLFDASHITRDISRLIYSSAYSMDHPQIRKALQLGIPIANYGETLAEIFNSKKGILVTGTHGKTTSTAMLGRILEDAGLDPTVVVGGEVLEWGRTARAGKSKWAVAEGDEYQAKILMLKPQALLLTNIEYDHPDFYKDEAAYVETFRKLLSSMDQNSIVVANESLKYLVEENTTASKIYFGGQADKEFMDSIRLSVWGEHNRMNALGVLRLAEALGVDSKKALETLSRFRGTRRRMELYTREDASLVIMDDYAHHPTEIQATLRALREHYASRAIVAIFQPHTYTRTKALMEDFAKSFKNADVVILLDIYGSQREKEKSVTGEDLYEATCRHHSNVLYLPTIEKALLLLENLKKPNQVIVTLGAGDVWKIAKSLTKEGSR